MCKQEFDVFPLWNIYVYMCAQELQVVVVRADGTINNHGVSTAYVSIWIRLIHVSLIILSYTVS